MHNLPSLLPVVLSLWLALLATPGQAQERVRLYAFGNSLVNHVSESPDTNVPVWLARLARADGRRFAMDGQFGRLRDFARDLPPAPAWRFRGVRAVWLPARRGFGEAGFTHVLIAPTNYIQDRAPHRAYRDGDPKRTSPLDATLQVLDWLDENAPGRRILLYQGWALMDRFAADVPADGAALAEYYAYNAGLYDDWYRNWLAALRKARPEADLTLIPVARIMARLFTEGPLATVSPPALYSDTAPHGTPTLYLLAAMISYPALFDAPLPERFRPPDAIHPALRDNYARVAAAIWEEMRGQARRETEPAPPPDAAPGTGAQEPSGPALRPDLHPNLRPALAERRERGLADPALAMGLNGIADWSTQQPFIDVFKTARRWIGHSAGKWGAWSADDLEAGGYLSPEGWPLALPEGATQLEALLLTDQPEASAPMLAGRYRVTWEGSGRLRILGRAGRVRIGAREAWFDYTPGEGAVAVAIYETDPEGNGDYIRNIRVVREVNIPLFEAGAVFNPDWLDVVGDLRALRFMDWMQTNNSEVESWDDRPKLSDATWSGDGVPLEIMLRLANRIGADPWFTMPHRADDTYIRRFAETVKAGLDPRLLAYVEYSNEVWNFRFDQALWARAQARARWGAAGEGDGWMQYAGLRAAEIMDIWTEIYGPQAPRRLRRVVAVHTGWPGLEEALLRAPLAVAEGRPPPAESFDAYAVSGYFGLELGLDAAAGEVRAWLEMPGEAGLEAAARALREGSLGELLDVLLPYHARVAAAAGLELIMYEGGTHLLGSGAQQQDADFTAFFIRLNYSDQMAVLYDELLSGWRAVGGTLFNAFVDVAGPSKFGSWGTLRHLGDDNPRWRVLVEYNRAGAGWETRAPGSFLGGVLLLGGAGDDVLAGSDKDDVLIAGPGDDMLVANGGADRLHGGEGLDVAVLAGTPGDWRLERRKGRVDAVGPGGTTTLFAVELVQFSQDAEEVIGLETLP